MICFRTIPIDSRFFVTNHKLKVLDVKWHPGSQTDTHLMVLTSDNNLRYSVVLVIALHLASVCIFSILFSVNF